MLRFNIVLCVAVLCLVPFWNVPPAGAISIEEARRSVVKGSLRYLNIPYLWGGEHPVTGFDCSGFVQQVFRDSGLYLPRTARDQYAATLRVSPRQIYPGDLIFFSAVQPGTPIVDHVGIYLGRGYFIAASTSHGVHIDSITSHYYLDRLLAIRKYGGF